MSGCRSYFHFFDGTGNNKAKDEPSRKWSNVARIYFATIPKNFVNSYSIYISGVGTPYNGNPAKWHSRPGVWLEDGALGKGAGAGGERRLRQGDDTVNDRLRDVLIANAKAMGGTVAAYAKASSKESFEDVNAALGKHRLIKVVNLSVFGFSRGAALARAFSNQVLDSCKDSGGNLLYHGYPLRLCFMGLFDTVASFGLPAKNVRTPFTQRDLIVSPKIERCVHYVAAHEVRGAFPVDLIRKHGKLAGEWLEVTYPGVHSDVGGGYEPREQQVDNNYARIPMRDMMREAAASGVRIMSYLDLKSARLKLFEERFECHPATYSAYTKYLAALGEGGGDIEHQIVAHQKLFYSICGTMRRNGINTPGDMRRNEDKYKYLGAKGMAFEIEAYRLAAAAGKRIRFAEAAVIGFARYMKPEQWQIDAWDSSATDGAVRFVANYVHDSMVDFLGNLADNSYFKARGVEEAGTSIWQELGQWYGTKAQSLKTATAGMITPTTAAVTTAAEVAAKTVKGTAAAAAQGKADEFSQEVDRIHEGGSSWIKQSTKGAWDSGS